MSMRAVVASLLSVLALAACGRQSEPSAPQQPNAGGDASASASAPAKSAPQANALALDPPSSGKVPQGAADREVVIEPSRDLGGALPLKHGIFVSADTPCGDPPNAALRRFDGEGLSGAHTHACHIKVLAKHGASYDIEQSCIDAGQGPGPRSTERATIDVQDNLTFVINRGGTAETFRYCAASTLPASLRKW